MIDGDIEDRERVVNRLWEYDQLEKHFKVGLKRLFELPNVERLEVCFTSKCAFKYDQNWARAAGETLDYRSDILLNTTKGVLGAIYEDDSDDEDSLNQETDESDDGREHEENVADDKDELDDDIDNFKLHWYGNYDWQSRAREADRYPRSLTLRNLQSGDHQVATEPFNFILSHLDELHLSVIHHVGESTPENTTFTHQLSVSVHWLERSMLNAAAPNLTSLSLW